MGFEPWILPEVIHHSQRLIDSFQYWTGRSLLSAPSSTPGIRAKQLFHAPFVVVSHGVQADPIFNYGNQTALDLWEFDWTAFTALPSRHSAEPIAQADRDRLLAEAKANGYIQNYRGVRISRTGRRFWIDSVILWDVLTEAGQPCGQAATFSTWQFL